MSVWLCQAPEFCGQGRNRVEGHSLKTQGSCSVTGGNPEIPLMKTDGWPQTTFPPRCLKVKCSCPRRPAGEPHLQTPRPPPPGSLHQQTSRAVPRIQGAGIWVRGVDAEGQTESCRLLFHKPALPTPARTPSHLPGWLKDKHLSWQSPDGFLLLICLEIPRGNLCLRGLVPLTLLRL